MKLKPESPESPEPFELSACPFCGGKAKLDSANYAALVHYWVSCVVCYASTSQYDYETIGAAMNAWNRREGDNG